MIQLDLFAAKEATRAAPHAAPSFHRRGVCREVQTRAAAHGGLITIYHDDAPDPFEVVVRGVPCVISYSGGFCTNAIDPAGSPFWSETGFRSFGYALADPAEIVGVIERYIDAPSKHGGGMDGRLTRWWPSYVLQWQQSLGFELSCAQNRSTMWAQWGPEKHTEAWEKHDRRLAEALEQMRIDGIDPNAVGSPRSFKGKWPKFEVGA